MKVFTTAGLLFLSGTLSINALAFEPLAGYFIAFDTCDAYQSKNTQTNPGDLKTDPMQAYQIRGINKLQGDYYQIIVPNAPVTSDRWIHVSCGLHVIDAQTGVDNTGDTDTDEGEVITPTVGSESVDNVLALSWQPAFCESKPNKTECIDLNNGHLPITEQQLSIHGLWAQPRGNTYCGVSNAIKAIDGSSRWSELPAPALMPDTAELLSVAMPGTASFLERHEWIKHGTCHRGEGAAQEYFADTLLLTQAINESVVADFLAAHVGASVNTQDIRQKFDEAFGSGAGDRVQFHCAGDQGRILLQEITIHLKGKISPDVPTSELILAGDETTLGCPQGVIDASGLQ